MSLLWKLNTLHWLYVLIAIILTAAVCSGYQVTPHEYDTIVVGLGAAGTVAASRLARAGKNVLALEAQERVGGRVYTVPFGDGVVEVGAEWIEGTEGSRTYEAAIANNVTILYQDLSYQITRSDGALAGAVITEILEHTNYFYEEKSNKAEPLGDYFAKKLTEYIKEKKPDVFEDKQLLERLLDFTKQSVANMWGAYDSKDLNAADSYVQIGGQATMSWHRNGYLSFFDIMLNKFKNGPGLPTLSIKLNTEVINIAWPQEANDKVLVKTKDGTVYKADNVIFTASLGVLKERYKTLFSPSLPHRKVTAIEKIDMGLIGKIIFSFPNTWWPSKNFMYGFLWKDEDLKRVDDEDQWTTKIIEVSPPMGSSNTLTVWTSGNVTKQVEVMADDVVKSKTIGVLEQFMGANITIPEPTGMIRSKWFSNEFTRGTYSYDSMSCADLPSARSDLVTPLVDAAGAPRVLFAGEATHSTRFATVHGAADTGHREAMRLLGSQQ